MEELTLLWGLGRVLTSALVKSGESVWPGLLVTDTLLTDLHVYTAGTQYWPALLTRQAPQSIYIFHFILLDDGYNARRYGLDHRAVSDEWL